MPAQSSVACETYRGLLEAIYKRWAPEKLKNVSGLMEKYKGQEAEVYSKAVSMYVFSQDQEHWRPLIYGMYKRFNPSKLSTFDQVLKKYKGQEATLYKALCNKYISELRVGEPPLEIYEWPSEEKKPENAGADEDDEDGEASDSPQASACTPVARGAGRSSDSSAAGSVKSSASAAGSEGSAGNEDEEATGMVNTNLVARATSSTVAMVKTTRPKARARSPVINGTVGARQSDHKDSDARVFRGAAPKARRRAPETSRAPASPEVVQQRRSLPENGSAQRRRLELFPSSGPESSRQDISPQHDSGDPKSHAAGSRRHSGAGPSERRGEVVLLPAPPERERSRSRSRYAVTLRPASVQACDRSRSREEQQEPMEACPSARHSKHAGTHAVPAERRKTRDRRRRRQQQVDTGRESADEVGPHRPARETHAEAPLPRRRSGDGVQPTVAGSLQAFVAAAPSNEGAGDLSELVEAEVEYRGEKVCFFLSRGTTLQDVADMYGSWVRALRGVAPQSSEGAA